MRIKLLFLGTSWAPTTFIGRKIEWLAGTGEFDIIVGITAPHKRVNRDFKIKGVRSIKFPHDDDPIIYRIQLFIRVFVRLLFYPRKLNKLIHLAKEQSKGLKDFLNTLLSFMLVTKERPDVVHFEWAGHAVKYINLLKYLNIPYTVSARGSQFTIEPLISSDFHQKLQIVLKNAQKVHCVAQSMEKIVKKIYPQSNTQTIYTAVDTDVFKCSNETKSQDSLNIIFIGSLIWKKAVDQALLIFRKFLDLGGRGHLYIVGDGEERQKLFFTIKDLNLAEQITYKGKLQENEVADILKDMDVLLLTSYAEGLANVIVEAMATCTVPIVTDVHGNREAFDNGREGFLFSPFDYEKAAYILMSLYSDPQKLHDIKYKARQRAENMFSIDKMNSAWKEFYMSIGQS